MGIEKIPCPSFIISSADQKRVLVEERLHKDLDFKMQNQTETEDKRLVDEERTALENQRCATKDKREGNQIPFNSQCLLNERHSWYSENVSSSCNECPEERRQGRGKKGVQDIKITLAIGGRTERW